MMKKVMMITGPTHTIPPLKGAAVETWMYEVSKRLSRYEPHIASISDPLYPHRECRDGIYFYRIQFSRLYKRLFQKMTKLDPLSYPKRIAHIINKVQPDIIHMHNVARWADSLIKLIKNDGIKKVLHMHNEFSDLCKTEVDLFIGCSNYITDSYRNSSIRAKYYSCIYNGVDLDRFMPYWKRKSERDNIREKFGINRDEFVVLYIGRVSPEKGVEHFVKSALMLKDSKNVRFFVVGEISRGNKSSSRVRYGKDILGMAAPLKDRIIFTDVFPPSQIHLLYLLGDVFVVPSNFNEPFGIVAIEAMSTGLPVIARQRGGLKEYIINGLNGFFIDEGNISEDIVQKINLLISNDGLRQKIGMEARRTVEKRFPWEVIASEVERQYGILTG
jgi:glycosyltransferase involved in cell wall biosynthesis